MRLSSKSVPTDTDVEASVRVAAALLGYSVFVYAGFIGLLKRQGTRAITDLLSNPDNVMTASTWPEALAALTRLKKRVKF